MTKVKRWYFRFFIVFAVVSLLMVGLLDAKASEYQPPISSEEPVLPDNPWWPPKRPW